MTLSPAPGRQAPATAFDLKAQRKEIREDLRDLCDTTDAHARQAEERPTASAKCAVAEIEDSEQRLVTAITEVTRQFEAGDTAANERITRSEARRCSWNRV